MFKPPSYSRCPSWTAANSHYRPFFGRLSTNMPRERHTNKCVVYRFRSSCALVSVWACQVGGGHGFWHFFLDVWVCVLMSRCIMDGWKPCWNTLYWPKIFGYAAAGLGQACLLEDTHWVAPMSIANVNMGWSLLSSPLEKKKILLILNNEHWTAQWPTWIICMAAYVRYDNRARCPGWFKQTSDEFHPIGIA